MPTYNKGNMLSSNANYLCITTNSVVKNDGSLVMGAGVAKQINNAFPGIAYAAGRLVQMKCGSLGKYGLLFYSGVYFFQVKYHFKDEADLGLIKYSTKMLKHAAEFQPDKVFALNYPGIGNGGLTKQQVEPIISVLPNNVEIWTFS